MLTDNFGRHVNYLRIAVTDRCNLRCLYCMPQEGLEWVRRDQLLSFEEISKLLAIFSRLGITKLRFTGGEPFMRRDFMDLVQRTVEEKWFDTISITTNGTLASPHIQQLKKWNIDSVNLSLDTIDPDRFYAMTRRNDFATVMETFHELQRWQIPTKINAIIMEGKNEEDLLALTRFTENYPVDVRFIEEMPFNGKGARRGIKWSAANIINELLVHFPEMKKLQDETFSTSSNYHIPGHLGNVGVIAAYTRSFCGSCNRIRLTPRGIVRTCLYDEGSIDLLTMLRSGKSEEELTEKIMIAVGSRSRDGFEAEKKQRRTPVAESMATIGG